MKKLKVTPKVVENVTTVVDEQGGPLVMLGKVVYVSCTSYAYTGKLTGVNDKFIELEEVEIVYETGPWSGKTFKGTEKLPTKTLCIFLTQVESMFEVVR